MGLVRAYSIKGQHQLQKGFQLSLKPSFRIWLSTSLNGWGSAICLGTFKQGFLKTTVLQSCIPSCRMHNPIIIAHTSSSSSLEIHNYELMHYIYSIKIFYHHTIIAISKAGFKHRENLFYGVGLDSYHRDLDPSSLHVQNSKLHYYKTKYKEISYSINFPKHP